MRRPSIRSGAFVLATLLSLAVVLQQLGPRPDPAWATSTPPPTPVPPNGSPSPFPTVLTTPRPSLTPPPLGAPSAILEDLDTGQVLFAKAPDGRRPMASLTKVMTALVVLSRARPGDPVVVARAAASQAGSVMGLPVGERLTVRELSFPMLLQSRNGAAV